MTKQKRIIVTDDGSNHIKAGERDAATGEIHLEEFPSRVIKGASMAVSGDSDYCSSSYETAEGRFSVKTKEMNILPTNNQDYQTSAHNRVLIHHALRRFGVEGDCEVVVTLPFEDYFDDEGNRKTSYLAQKAENVKKPVRYMDGTPSAVITKVHLIPECLPSAAFVCEKLGLPDGLFILADIGGTTSDIGVYSEGSISRFASLRMGAFEMLYAFRDQLETHFSDTNFTEEKVKQLFGDSLEGRAPKTEEYAIKIRNTFAAKLMSEIQQKFGTASSFDGVILAGGGATYFDLKTMKSTYNGEFYRTERPQFNNCEGAFDLLGI
jgi:plasmid segregation protein ParM